MNNERKTNNSESKQYAKYNECKHLPIHNDNQLLRKYVHDIRNTTTFSTDILTNINNFEYDDRMEILIVYNEMISYYLSLFEEDK